MRDNLNATHWNVEDGYQTNVNESELYPNRVFSKTNSIRMKTELQVDKAFGVCNELFDGFELSIHMPDELPKFDSNFILIPAQYNAYIFFKPKMFGTSEGLRRYAPHIRGCFFKSERQLRFFKSYSQQKCELECLANFTKTECDCVQFWVPSELSLINIYCL